MSKHLLSPQGEFPAAGLGRRLAAMFYDFLLCVAPVSYTHLTLPTILLV